MRRLFPVTLLPIVLTVSLLAATPFEGQTSARKRATGPPPVTLTPEAAKVLDTLDSLQQLPLGEWRYHAGDMSHGEDVTLDDAKWQSVTATDHKPFTAPNDAVWFRQTVEVPKSLHGYDLTGTTVWFHFSIDANGSVPLIVYFNGRRVAMGEDLEPIVLFDKARPGDRAVIAVKALHTVDTKSFSGAEATVQFGESGANSGPEARPNPLGFATEARCAQVLIPSVAADNTQAPAALNAAISLVSLDALASGDKKKFDESLLHASQQLAQLRPLLQQTIVRMAGNAHIDAAWLWPESETVDVTKRTFGTVLQLMQEYGFTFTQSAAAYSEWIEQKYPDEFAQIQEKVKEHKWELVGGMWVEPDLNLPSGESLVRQLLVGKEYFHKKFGVDVTVGWNPDSFGYNFQLPQIYKKSGVDYFVTQKMWWNDTNPLPLKLFWWQGLDGSRVLTYFPHDYVNEIEPLKIAKDFAAARALNPGTNEMLHLYGVGDHGGGPTRAMLDAAESWMQPGTLTSAQSNGSAPVLNRAPVLSYSFAETYFHDVEHRLDTAHSPVWNYATLADMQKQGIAPQSSLPAPPAGQIALPVWNDELYLEYHRGVFTTQAAHKRNMRESEDWLTNAEKWSSLTWLAGDAYPYNALNEAWKLELFNQFHDLAAGSGINVIYKDAQKDYDVIHWTANDATGHAMSAITSHINTRPPEMTGSHRATLRNLVPIVVTNPLPWKVTGVVTPDMVLAGALSQITDGTGARMPLQWSADNTHKPTFVAKDVPALGYKVFYASPNDSPANIYATSASGGTGFSLDNEFLSVAVDKSTGCITRLVNKKTNVNAIADGGCGNELQAFTDTPKDYDAWNIDPGTLDHYTAISQADSVSPASHDAGFAYQQIKIERHFGKSKVTQYLRLYSGLPYVTVITDVDWHETHVLLKAAFPLAATSDHASYEIPYGTIERPTTRNNSFENARFEVPALRWADLGDGKNGFSLINDSKFGYDCAGNVLRLTLLRSPTWPDPDADRGPQHFEYALYPHEGTWQDANTVRVGYEFNNRLTASQAFIHDGSLPAEKSFASVDAPNVILSAVKRSEDGNALIVRLYESSGKATHAKVQLAIRQGKAAEANLMEKPGTPLRMENGSVEVDFAPWEIKTLRIETLIRNSGMWTSGN